MDGLVDAGFVVLGGPLDDEVRVVHAIEAPRRTRAIDAWRADPWSDTHLGRVDHPVDIRLDARAR